MVALPTPAGLEERIEAFESAWKHDHDAAFAEFLPPRNSPSFLRVLCELVRVDLELKWEVGQRRDLEHYLGEFPALRESRAALEEVAFEEYRQRLRAGDQVSPAEYGQAYGIDVGRWPQAAGEFEHAGLGDEAIPTQEFSDRELERAMLPEEKRAKLAEGIRRSTRKPPIAFPRVGEDWQGFQLIDELGRGTFGRVYLARQRELADRLVALKVSTDLTGEPQKLAQLQHTNIMPVYSAHQVGKLQAVCMPFFGSTTLAQLIRGLRQNEGSLPKSGRMFLSTLMGRSRTQQAHSGDSGVHSASALSAASQSQPEAPAPSGQTPEPRSMADLEKLASMSHVNAVLWIVARVTDGLVHAHERGILHRDLKPANILLTDDGQPMLLDFNLAANLNVAKGRRVKLGGTFPYMAPEQLEAMQSGARTVDARSDLYSLGVILFELLTGRHPFGQPKGKTSEVVPQLLAERRGARPDPRRHNRHVSPAVAAIVAKLLAPDPRDRYQSAKDLREDLQCQQQNLPLRHAPNTSVAERMVKFRLRNPRLCTAVGVALAASVFIVAPVALMVAHDRKFKRNDALVRMHDAEKNLLAAQIDLGAKNFASTRRQHGARLVEQVSAAYAIDPDGRWLREHAVSRLAESERRKLIGDLGNTFLVMARTLHQEALDKNDVSLDEQALLWNKRAEVCFVSLGSIPERVGSQRAAISDHRRNTPLEPEAAPEKLARMDEADLFAMACDMESIGRYRLAIRFLTELTHRNPSHFMAWYMKGLCHSGLGDYAASIEALTACVALNPDNPAVYRDRGVALSKMRLKDRLQEAELDFSRALAIDPTLTDALVRRADARLDLRNLTGTLEDLTEATRRDDAPTRIWFRRYEVLTRLGRHAEAKNDLGEGLRREPNDEWSWTARSYYRINANDLDGALQDCDKALALNPRYCEALQNKAYVLGERQGKLEEANAVLRKMIDYYPDYLAAHMGLGVNLARQGHAAEAAEEAQFVLSLDRSAYFLYKVGSLYAVLAGTDPNAKEQAFQLLGHALRKGYDKPEEFATDPDLNPIRSDPEFRKLSEAALQLQRLKVKR
jgi:serine/threonine protein kinase/predicted Zn-dependent protease